VDDQPIAFDVLPDTPSTTEACRHLVLIDLEYLDAIPTHLADAVDPLLD
jgi:hypothetical protein